jgi:tRNA nucleotidyltransferase (CCA-adding enzyme)
LRAVRFEQRFSFRIEPQTLAWLCQAAHEGMLERVQKHRLRDELVLFFKEREPLAALKRLHDLCGYDFVSSGLTYRRAWTSGFARIRKAVLWFEQSLPHQRRLDIYVMFLCLFFSQLSPRRLKEVILAYAFHKGEGLRFLSFKTQAGPIQRRLLKKDLPPSGVYRLLEPLSYEIILLMYALGPKVVQRRIRDFLLMHHGTRLHVRGEDLAGLGSRPGPHFKKVLTNLLSAKVDGKVKDRQEELALAGKLLFKKRKTTTKRSD